MRIIALLIILLGITSCTYFEPKDLKSPCVAAPGLDGKVTPCIKRKINDQWLA